MNFVISKIFCFVILFFCSICSQSDDLKEQFNYAKQLFDNEQYFDAITELKRLQFFDSGKEYSYPSNEMIAACYKFGGKYNEAVHYFNLAELNAKTIGDIYNVKIEIIRVNILRRTTNRALQLLDEVEKDIRFERKPDEINYWRGWAHIFADNWKEAAKSFSLIDSQHELKLFCEKVADEKYSVTFARIASAILPGAGQFYTGNYISGFLSLGWNVLWGYISINAFIEDRVFDGIMVTNFLWLRFYLGNLHNAERFAEEKNLEIVNDALYYLQNSFYGLKP
jgi:hypothetical protein